jgi:hypothetical protein
MMLGYSLNQALLAELMENAVAKVLASGPLTPDFERTHPCNTWEINSRVYAALGRD